MDKHKCNGMYESYNKGGSKRRMVKMMN